MRRWFWCGCAVMVTAAAFVYMTARHVQRHPGNLAVHVGRGAWQALHVFNPVVAVGMKTANLLQGMMVRPVSPCPKPALAPSCSPREPQSWCEAIPEVIDLTSACCREPNTCSFPSESMGPSAELEVVTILPGEIEENEAPIPTEMPPCDDDEQPQPIRRSVAFWANLFQSDSEEDSYRDAEPLPMPQERESDSAEEENEALEDGSPPDCQEAPDYHERYPDCPSMRRCPYSGKCPPACPGPGMDPNREEEDQ